jgi:hypothetical protein
VGGLVGWLGGLYDLTPWGQNNHFSQTLALHTLGAVFGEVNELVSCSSICRLALPFSQETRAAAQISRQ